MPTLICKIIFCRQNNFKLAISSRYNTRVIKLEGEIDIEFSRMVWSTDTLICASLLLAAKKHHFYQTVLHAYTSRVLTQTMLWQMCNKCAHARRSSRSHRTTQSVGRWNWVKRCDACQVAILRALGRTYVSLYAHTHIHSNPRILPGQMSVGILTAPLKFANRKFNLTVGGFKSALLCNSVVICFNIFERYPLYSCYLGYVFHLQSPFCLVRGLSANWIWSTICKQ